MTFLNMIYDIIFKNAYIFKNALTQDIIYDIIIHIVN